MKLHFRLMPVMLATAVSIAAVLLYSASERMDRAGKASLEASDATLHTYRTAQKLKSLVHAYELAINEYYSTVLEFPEYQKKTAEIKLAIDAELARLEQKNTHPETEVAKLNAAYRQIEILRQEIENALSGPNRNWDLAREVLYKLNLVSLQAVQAPEIIARVAEERAAEMEAVRKLHHTQALLKLKVAEGLILLAIVLALSGMFRPAPAVPQQA